MAQKVRNFVGTWHKSQYDAHKAVDVSDEEFAETWVGQALAANKIVKYAAWQLERGETNEGLHVQMYLETTTPTTFARVQKIFPGMWTCARKASREQARDYAMKQETRVVGPFQWGEWNAQGERTDLAGLAQMVIDGMRLQQIAQTAPVEFVRYSRGLQALRTATAKRRDINKPPEVHVRWGEPGSGKTRHVYDNHDHDEIWTYSGGGTWFDGYDGHKVALFDDFYGGLPFHLLLRITDRYPIKVPYKGGFVEFNPDVIYFTSNVHPEQWYKNIPSKEALLRRITTITKVGDENYEAQGDGHDSDASAFM